MNKEYSIELIGQIENSQNDNVDVFVHFLNGESYMASYFTIHNIKRLIEKNESTGDCCEGLYFWSSDMIIITEITESNIKKSVNDLITTGGFYIAFEPTNEKAKIKKIKMVGEYR